MDPAPVRPARQPPQRGDRRREHLLERSPRVREEQDLPPARREVEHGMSAQQDHAGPRDASRPAGVDVLVLRPGEERAVGI
ncbi:MAG TPA: hypothetical protein PLR32_09420, partial [candidate division Zixibacteria bacterium]|nr:hypothetical protein [candidate division Zixibacteria bacterium]